MAFNLNLTTDSGSLCDKCKKPASEEKPMLDMWTTGRSYDQRNFIQVHKHCLERAIQKEQREAVEQPAQPKEQVNA